MANIDTGSASSKRDLNRDVPLIPFIDFMLCLVSFLLVTAVWSQSSRLEADAQVPRASEGPVTPPEKRLHVAIRDQRFELTWKQGETVLSSTSVPRKAVTVAPGVVRYPELAKELAREWQAHRAHQASTDPKNDTAVLHTSNTEAFGELAAVIDALHGPDRELQLGGTRQRVAAFSVSFAAN